jgi:hypothetical protein
VIELVEITLPVHRVIELVEITPADRRGATQTCSSALETAYEARNRKSCTSEWPLRDDSVGAERPRFDRALRRTIEATSG